MDSLQYVKDHDFGFGEENEKKELKKLLLRNKEDLKVYACDVLENAFFTNDMPSDIARIEYDDEKNLLKVVLTD